MNKFKFVLCLANIVFATVMISCSNLGENILNGEASLNDETSDENNSSNNSAIFSCEGGEYLGIGYDVINSSYINRADAKLAFPVLDKNKMCQDGIIESVPAYTQDLQIFTGNSVKEFYRARNSSISVSAGLNVDASIFFSGKYQFEFSDKQEENASTNTYYSRLRSYRYTQDDYIKNATSQNLSKYLNESFVNDLKSKTASEIFNLYGTHIFIRYFKGGSLEANYVYNGTSLTSSSQITSAVQASFTVSVLSDSSGVSNSKTWEQRNFEQNSSFKYYTYGGKALGSTSIEQLGSEYGLWTESIASNADICDIGDFNQSFVSIWALAEAIGDTLKAAELLKEFYIRAAGQEGFLKAAKIFETARTTYTTSGLKTISNLVPSGATIAEIEIYALGAGGGGQGGDYNNGVVNKKFGTGGAGGGGAATYVKLANLGLEANANVSFNVSVGTGGTGGGYYSSGAGGTNKSGNSGTSGGATTVSWVDKDINIKAEGGIGAGGSGVSTANGSGGRASSLPTFSAYYVNGVSESGKSGSGGSWTSDVASTGGSAAMIRMGSINPFGGGNGATRIGGSGAKSQPAENGGGGCGRYAKNSGIAGGDGFVAVVVKYYTMAK